ncbi:hypothetical protein HMPREF0591_3813 [Mycobacterium parascrofulaceum ATCC BAA-614]|uniref:Lipoprotein LpqN n=1 Tax=Mycobacterium parascrofulaceum ATCC BAA-614 TaxID=525368 RepID=D5PCB9_9MYCO|nr:hypothetical protein HMPREF0591_3813 [Mycobacterium parascrofulaceum ATCC BAA-614]
MALCVLAVPAVGCEKTTAGTAIGGTGSATTSTTRLSDPAEPVPGVETTLPDHIPPNALVCFPPPPASGSMTKASVADPAAPVLTVALPDGWPSTPGTGDVALTSAGPDGMSVRVTIARTDLDPGGAFLRYASDVRTARPGVKVTVTAAQFCGYSSQLLSGTGGGTAANDFADRITHVWTNTQAYLVVVHLEAPGKSPGFEAAKSTVTQQFAVIIP